MKQPDSTKFLYRQYMISQSYELYYYKDYPVRGVEPHEHGFYELYFFLEGSVEMTIGGKCFRVHPGDIVLIPPGIRHFPSFIDPKTPYRRFVLWIHKDYYEKCFAHEQALAYLFERDPKGQTPVLTVDPVIFNDLQNKLFQMIREKNEERFGKALSLSLMLQSVLLSISRSVYEKENGDCAGPVTLRARICTYVEEHLREPLTLEDIAGFFAMNKYYISHIFKESMGISLHQYIIQRRIEACKNALLTQKSLEEIAELFGFANYSSFFRLFKKTYGMSPKEYREEMEKELGK
ncbi:MAG TPA: AraC family transcriptional regulator [Candidatus Scybalocola faecigallinarum]|uniref:AraC family transcriptional regulator n=1 Tax=Candidatus Scybalocola faecigallinarum TaxID=2840941 RepID=A0A9D1JRY6_9FIRM|nr:AraC family transcriptional regulator [Candidatus Scybalocola faecigallinarum]